MLGGKGQEACQRLSLRLPLYEIQAESTQNLAVALQKQSKNTPAPGGTEV